MAARVGPGLLLEGATCPSCAYTIESVGRKMKGVEEVHVVRQIGYDADRMEDDSDGTS